MASHTDPVAARHVADALLDEPEVIRPEGRDGEPQGTPPVTMHGEPGAFTVVA